MKNLLFFIALNFCTLQAAEHGLTVTFADGSRQEVPASLVSHISFLQGVIESTTLGETEPFVLPDWCKPRPFAFLLTLLHQALDPKMDDLKRDDPKMDDLLYAEKKAIQESFIEIITKEFVKPVPNHLIVETVGLAHKMCIEHDLQERIFSFFQPIVSQLLDSHSFQKRYLSGDKEAIEIVRTIDLSGRLPLPSALLVAVKFHKPSEDALPALANTDKIFYPLSYHYNQLYSSPDNKLLLYNHLPRLDWNRDQIETAFIFAHDGTPLTEEQLRSIDMKTLRPIFKRRNGRIAAFSNNMRCIAMHNGSNSETFIDIIKENKTEIIPWLIIPSSTGLGFSADSRNFIYVKHEKYHPIPGTSVLYDAYAVTIVHIPSRNIIFQQPWQKYNTYRATTLSERYIAILSSTSSHYGSEGRTISVYDIRPEQNEALLWEKKGAHNIAFSPNQEYVAYRKGTDDIFHDRQYYKVYLRPLKAPQAQEIVYPTKEEVTSIAFTEDSRMVCVNKKEFFPVPERPVTAAEQRILSFEGIYLLELLRIHRTQTIHHGLAPVVQSLPLTIQNEYTLEEKKQSFKTRLAQLFLKSTDEEVNE